MIFVDTSAWLAVSDPRDGNHGPALDLHQVLLTGEFGRLITSDFVLDETLTLIRKRSGAGVVRSFVEGLAASPSVQQIWITPEHFREAQVLFLGQGTKTWSLTDCTSFVLMRELGLVRAFTFDKDFREAGFETRPG